MTCKECGWLERLSRNVRYGSVSCNHPEAPDNFVDSPDVKPVWCPMKEDGNE